MVTPQDATNPECDLSNGPSVLVPFPIVTRREGKVLPKTANEILYVGESAQTRDVGYVVTQIAQKMQTPFEPYLV